MGPVGGGRDWPADRCLVWKAYMAGISYWISLNSSVDAPHLAAYLATYSRVDDCRQPDCLAEHESLVQRGGGRARYRKRADLVQRVDGSGAAGDGQSEELHVNALGPGSKRRVHHLTAADDQPDAR